MVKKISPIKLKIINMKLQKINILILMSLVRSICFSQTDDYFKP